MKPLRHATLEDAEPLTGPGRRSIETLLALSERDRLLREMVARFFPDLSQREAARQVRTRLLRFSTGAWRRERACPFCPARHAGTLSELLWRLLRARDAIPSEATVRRALAIREPRAV